ncbi:A/B superfamily hydrolase [Rhodotorula taiwanensis]|uniref:A/B superfamily hydrolase n=1 Tax=Rhodotorula taiwanensis TaxID=741276 RepID=A0A2S5B5M1_9BASI|nr:A/B superfamily hydrolase [Rhodotorula taiwanensis]
MAEKMVDREFLRLAGKTPMSTVAATERPAASLIPKQTLYEKLTGIVGILQILFTGAFRHYAVGPPSPSWPLLASTLVYLIRVNSVRTSRKNVAAPPKSRAQLVAVAQQKSLLDNLALKNDAVPGAVVKEIEIPVRKRELPGLLNELSKQESGDRTIGAEWTISDSLLKSAGSAYQEPRAKVVLFLHGGAHIRLSPRTHRRTVAAISRELKCRVLSVDYRLSPGVVFPASTLDSVAAYLYLTEELGIAASDIIVSGDSAGGNLCLTLMQYLRDADLPQVGAAYLLSPWCDLSTSFASWNYNTNSDYIAIDNEEDPYHAPYLYLSDVYPRTAASRADYHEKKASGYVSQALAPLEALKNLPPMLVHTGGLETLVDENITLVRRLRLADGKNDVTHQLWTDGVHVFQALQDRRSGASAFREAGKWYARLLSSEGAEKNNAGWTTKVDELLEAEKTARVARAGPIKPVKPADPTWKFVRSVERLQDPACKSDAHEMARKAADEAARVTGAKAEAEVFRPVRA